MSALLAIGLALPVGAEVLSPEIYDPLGVGALGVRSGASIGVVLEDVWDVYGGYGADEWYVSSAQLYLLCDDAGGRYDGAGHVGAIARIDAPPSAWAEGELPPSVEPITFSMDGCGRGLVIDVTEHGQAWLEGSQTWGLALVGGSLGSDWQIPLVLESGGSGYAPWLRVYLEVWSDEDGDGYSALEDCDDYRTAVHPGADETCDDRDEDCDGDIDEGFDGDGDGYPGCEGSYAPADCDDADPEVHPETPELCDGFDNDCDAAADEGCVYDGADNDLDGFREIDGDSDDADPDVFPGAAGAPTPTLSGLDPVCDAAPPEPPAGCAHARAPRCGWALVPLAFARRRRCS